MGGIQKRPEGLGAPNPPVGPLTAAAPLPSHCECKHLPTVTLGPHHLTPSSCTLPLGLFQPLGAGQLLFPARTNWWEGRTWGFGAFYFKEPSRECSGIFSTHIGFFCNTGQVMRRGPCPLATVTQSQRRPGMTCLQVLGIPASHRPCPVSLAQAWSSWGGREVFALQHLTISVEPCAANSGAESRDA